MERRCPVCGKMVKNRDLHIIKRHPKAYPDLDYHYYETFQSGGAIKRKAELKRKRRESRKRH